MSGFGPTGEGNNPFEGIFGDLARLLGNASSGPINWDVARQVAALIAGEGQSEPNVDPIERIRLEELVRVAELHVAQRSGLSVVIRHIDVVSHVDWATRTLEAHHDVLERMAESLSRHADVEPGDPFASPDSEAGMMAQFSQMEHFISPMLLGMQVGGMVGHLSRRSLGQYDLPVPRAGNDTLMFVSANINEFSSEWNLPLDELSLYVAIEETTRLAVMARPHVKARFTELINDYVSGFEPDGNGLADRLGELDISDPSQLPAALTNPNALLGAIQTPRQQQTLSYLNALVAAFVGYVDHIVSDIASRTISSAGAIAEANKRRRVEETDGARLVEKLLGLEMGQPTFDRGDHFITGIAERAGDVGLARLWESEQTLPTPAEIPAPGLWLERIDLPE